MSHQKGARDGLQVGCQSFVFEVSVLFEGEVCWVASGGKVTQDTALPWVRGWRSLQVYSDGDEWRSVVMEPEHQWERIGKRRILIISLWQCLKGYPQKKRHSTATARCVQFLCCRRNWSINHGPSLYVSMRGRSQSGLHRPLWMIWWIMTKKQRMETLQLKVTVSKEKLSELSILYHSIIWHSTENPKSGYENYSVFNFPSDVTLDVYSSRISGISPNSLLQCWPATSSCSSWASFPARPSPHNTRQASLVLFW